MDILISILKLSTAVILLMAVYSYYKRSKQ